MVPPVMLTTPVAAPLVLAWSPRMTSPVVVLIVESKPPLMFSVAVLPAPRPREKFFVTLRLPPGTRLMKPLLPAALLDQRTSSTRGTLELISAVPALCETARSTARLPGMVPAGPPVQLAARFQLPVPALFHEYVAAD